MCVCVCDVIKMAALSHVFAEEDTPKTIKPTAQTLPLFAIIFTTLHPLDFSGSVLTGNYLGNMWRRTDPLPDTVPGIFPLALLSQYICMYVLWAASRFKVCMCVCSYVCVMCTVCDLM